MLGSVLGWGTGTLLGPAHDVKARAREVGEGVVFDAPLELQAYGALLAWPIAAMAVHLALTALFGPRDPEPEWDLAPYGPPPPPPAARAPERPAPGADGTAPGVAGGPARPGRYTRPTGARTAPVSSARWAGASSTSRPRRPADTQIVPCRDADASSTVASLLRCPSGEMPPRT